MSKHVEWTKNLERLFCSSEILVERLAPWLNGGEIPGAWEKENAREHLAAIKASIDYIEGRKPSGSR